MLVHQRVDITPINHSYWSYKATCQLSYLGGLTLQKNGDMVHMMQFSMYDLNIIYRSEI